MEEKCHACEKSFENPDLYGDHVMNVHPVTLRCLKCQGIMKIWYPYKDRPLFQERKGGFFEYVCSECGFVGDRYATTEFQLEYRTE